MLSIAFPHAFDSHSILWATLNNLREKLIDEDMLDHTEVVLCDNTPEKFGAEIKSLVNQFEGKYVALPSPKGTAPPRNEAIRNCTMPTVLMMDAHVNLRRGTLTYIKGLIERNEVGKDLHYGALLKSEIRKKTDKQEKLIWSEWEPRFGGDGMFGRGHINPQAMNPNNPPYEIQHSGTGLFLFSREDFLWYHPQFRGFGLEGYMTAKYIKAGRKIWTHPGLRWMHWFRPKAIPSGHEGDSWKQRAANLLWQLKDLHPHPFFTIEDVYEVCVKSGRLPPGEWDALLRNINAANGQLGVGKPGAKLKQVFESIGIYTRDDCDCKAKMAAMDQMGYAVCVKNFHTVKGWLLDGYESWGWKEQMGVVAAGSFGAIASGAIFTWLDRKDVLGSALKEALRLTELELKQAMES